ncbi:MAG: hypothetical protein GY950_03520 [bacterium]|nr:hypothetical protein [bacterium]
MNIKMCRLRLLKVLAVLVVGVLMGATPLMPQQQTEDLVEYVEVTNVELIVRALRAGKPVGGLEKSDFTLRENGKQLKITSFTEVRRKIGEKKTLNIAPETENTMGQREIKRPKTRLFLLYFWIAERELKYREALDYFFEKVYSDGDIVLMVIKNKAFEIRNRDQIAGALKDLNTEIKKASVDLQSGTRSTVRYVEDLYRQYIDELKKTYPDINKLERLRSQIGFHLDAAWQEFQYKNLISNNRQLLHLADALKDVDLEKWGMVFYQENVFPHFDMVKIDGTLRRDGYENEVMKMKQFMMNFRMKTRLPNFSFFNMEKIKQAFVNGETTFHVLWMNTKKTLEMESAVFEVQDVFSGWMETFKGISRVTGGEVIRANKLKETLEKVVDREDIFYRITYKPALVKDEKEKREITVKVRGDGLKVFHLKRVAFEKAPQNF